LYHFRGWTEEEKEITPQQIKAPSLPVWTMNCFGLLTSKDDSKEDRSEQATDQDAGK
jgi:hypothetical protein